MADPTVRFLDLDEHAKRRRRMRLYMRARKGRRQDDRTNRRTKLLPCCGRERRYCKCYLQVEHMINSMAVEKLGDNAYKRDLLTKKDPKDMSFILRALHRSRFSIHKFLFHSVLFRMYSKESTYTALRKHASAPQPGIREPDWAGMEVELANLYAGSDPVWGGMFYPATLRKAKCESGRWRKFRAATPADKAKRDVQVFKVVWAAICSNDSAAAYMKQRQRCSSTCWKKNDVHKAREAFKRWYVSFYDHINDHTKGWFGDYAMKCILDVGTNCSIKGTKGKKQVFPDAVLSKWPVDCPRYKKQLRKLLKPKYQLTSMNADLKYKLLMYIHAILSKRLGAAHHSVSSTLAQLCWEKRQAKTKRGC